MSAVLASVRAAAFNTSRVQTDRAKRRQAAKRSMNRSTRPCGRGFRITITVTEKGGKEVTRYYASDGKGGITGPHESPTTRGLKSFARRRAANRHAKRLSGILMRQRGEKYTWPTA